VDFCRCLLIQGLISKIVDYSIKSRSESFCAKPRD
jgi:hypothetical protein